jgi:hypothetical protein
MVARAARGIDKNQTDNVVALLRGKHARVSTAEGMPDDNERALFAGRFEQGIKLAADGFGVSRPVRRIAPAVSWSVIGTDAGRRGDHPLNPHPIQRSSAGSLF